MLLLELSLIRWLGANLVHLSYFSNIVLLGSFLGIGLGFLAARPDSKPPLWTLPLLAVLVLTILPGTIAVDRTGSDLIFFTSLSVSGPRPEVILPLVFLVVAGVLYGVGVMVGQCFFGLPRLTAYRLDLIGSLTGIAVFTMLSFLNTPPVVWAGLAVLLTAVLSWRTGSVSRFAAIGLVVMSLAGTSLLAAFTYESTRPDTLWSPYYKIETETVGTTIGDWTTVTANGVPHQAVTGARARSEFEPLYDLPYQRSTRTEPGDVLIVGAGTGTDVALALLEGADSVDAVEIDAQIRALGDTKNPDRPYQDPAVTHHIGDGREFLEQSDRTYDTILFALPDSLTLLAGSSQLRLESYLFTSDALEQVHERLADDGVFAMYNYYREPWLVGRLGATIADAFGHQPCIDLNAGNNAATIVVAKDPAMQACGTDTDVAALLAVAPPPVDDDRPFLYLRDPHIPTLYLVVIGFILLASLVSVRVVAGPLRRTLPYGDLFLLGVAFLLLETRAVTMFALLFGTTWLVNAIVFAGILVAVLAAVEVTRWLRTRGDGRIPLPVAYVVLFIAIAVAWAVPLEALLEAPPVLRAVLAGAITFAPVFAANIVFASRFANTPEPALAFGINLLGAMVGGCLEYIALITGYRALLIVAALLYIGALLLGRLRISQSAVDIPAAPAPVAGSTL